LLPCSSNTKNNEKQVARSRDQNAQTNRPTIERWRDRHAGLARPWLLAFGFLAFSSFFE
jgi:hypothetical protein